jgi:hypothetical protein
MFYVLNINFLNSAGDKKTQRIFFKNYEKGYLTQSKKAYGLLENNPGWQIASDFEEPHAAARFRLIRIKDASGENVAELELARAYFSDLLY